AMLALAGELNPRMYGVSAHPRLPDNISKYAWKPDAKVEDQNRRSIYVFVKRNMRFPLFDVFDWPDLHNSCGRRAVTTTAPQALLLLNSNFTTERSNKISADLIGQYRSDDAAIVGQGYRIAWGRFATNEEVKLGLSFLGKQMTLLEGKGEKNARAVAIADF